MLCSFQKLLNEPVANQKFGPITTGKKVDGLTAVMALLNYSDLKPAPTTETPILRAMQQLLLLVVCLCTWGKPHHEHQMEDACPHADDELNNNDAPSLMAPVIRNGARRMWMHDMIHRTKKMRPQPTSPPSSRLPRLLHD